MGSRISLGLRPRPHGGLRRLHVAASLRDAIPVSERTDHVMARYAFRYGMTGPGYRPDGPVSLRSRLRYRRRLPPKEHYRDGEETVLARRKPRKLIRYDGTSLQRQAARQFPA